MNAGLSEAEDLAGLLAKVLRDGAAPESLEAYSRMHRDKWEELLGMKGGLRARPEANAWVKEHSTRILPCMPALGEDLAGLANQLGFDF